MNAIINTITSTQLLTLALVASCTALVISLVVAGLCLIRQKKMAVTAVHLQEQVNASANMLENTLAQLHRLEEKLGQTAVEQNLCYTELEQVTKQLEHRIKKLNDDSQQQQSNLLAMQSQNPEDRLYRRALKLVKLGAGIDEIMKECDLPQAEAEMLLAIHNKKAD